MPMLLAAWMALAAVTAWAQPRDISSVHVGNQIIKVGDSRARVVQVAGEPDHVVQLENRFGGATGQRFEYWSIGVGGGYQRIAVTVEFTRGTVTRITSEALR